jgi:hypothetical protein
MMDDEKNIFACFTPFCKVISDLQVLTLVFFLHNRGLKGSVVMFTAEAPMPFHSCILLAIASDAVSLITAKQVL